MNRLTSFIMPIIALTLFSLASFGSLAPALAASVTDTFPLKATVKEWCRDDPRFVETATVKPTDGVTLTLTRDVLNTGDLSDIQATISIGNATIDSLTLHGRALLANKSGSIAQLVLSGTDPGNSSNYITIRGQATFNKAGNLTKVTGTFTYEILGASGLSQNSDCFGSGTFATGTKLQTGGLHVTGQGTIWGLGGQISLSNLTTNTYIIESDGTKSPDFYVTIPGTNSHLSMTYRDLLKEPPTLSVQVVCEDVSFADVTNVPVAVTGANFSATGTVACTNFNGITFSGTFTVTGPIPPAPL